MKFKGRSGWRELDHTDNHGDDMCVAITLTTVYVSGSSCALTHKQARKLAKAILKETEK